MKALKLIWLSDRLHLRKFGRLITGDEYFALPNGPIPSATRDILENSDFLDDAASDYATEYINPIDRYTFKALVQPNLNVFSETDIDVINQVFEKFSGMDHFALSELSHLFPEWKKYESALNTKISSRFRIELDEFFTNIKEDSGLYIDSPESIEISRQIFDTNQKFLSAL